MCPLFTFSKFHKIFQCVPKLLLKRINTFDVLVYFLTSNLSDIMSLVNFEVVINDYSLVVMAFICLCIKVEFNEPITYEDFVKHEIRLKILTYHISAFLQGASDDNKVIFL